MYVDTKKELGFCFVRGTSIELICPSDGYTSIANPYAQL